MNLNDYSEFCVRSTRKTLKDTSYDETNDTYMTENEIIVIDFDQAKTSYCNKLGVSNEYAASADALCKVSDKKFYLIEFKNGSFKDSDIKKKAKESAVILSGITGLSINEIRESVTFILVYNKNNRRVQSKDQMALALANKGKIDFALFGLGQLRGLYYDSVYAVDIDNFNKSAYLKDIISL